MLSVQYKILNVQDKYKIKKNVCLSVCMYVRMHACLHMDICMGPMGFGDLGRRDIYFQGDGGTGNYFKGAGEQPHGFGNLGSPVKSKK